MPELDTETVPETSKPLQTLAHVRVVESVTEGSFSTLLCAAQSPKGPSTPRTARLLACSSHFPDACFGIGGGIVILIYGSVLIWYRINTKTWASPKRNWAWGILVLLLVAYIASDKELTKKSEQTQSPCFGKFSGGAATSRFGPSKRSSQTSVEKKIQNGGSPILDL